MRTPDKETIGKSRLVCRTFCSLSGVAVKPCWRGADSHRQTELETVGRGRRERERDGSDSKGDEEVPLGKE